MREVVDARVDDVSYLYLRLLHQVHDAVALHLDHAVLGRALGLRHHHGQSVLLGQEVGDELCVDQVVPGHDQEVLPVQLGPGQCQGVCRAQGLLLDHVLDGRAELLPILEVEHYGITAVADHHDDLLHAVLDQRLHDVLEDGAIAHRYHALRARHGEGT